VEAEGSGDALLHNRAHVLPGDHLHDPPQHVVAVVAVEPLGAGRELGLNADPQMDLDLAGAVRRAGDALVNGSREQIGCADTALANFRWKGLP
jgi:hypothetical protein